jgi:outer membrane lipase/esterase
MTNRLLLSALLVVSITLSGGARATAFSGIYVFGDSLSDSGSDLNLSSAIHSVNPAFPIVPGAPADLAGRFSNGPVAVEYLANILGLPLTPHYVTPPFLGGQTAGTNYAQGGATTGSENASLPGSLGNNLSTGFKGVTGEVKDYRNSVATANPTALYIVWGGPNDFIHPGSTATLPSCKTAINPAICTGVTNLANAVGLLASMGAEHILVPNMPDLGVTPKSIAAGPATVAAAHSLSAAFDAALAVALLNLSAQSPGVIVPVDTFSLVDQIVHDPSAFGFLDVSHPCLTGSSADSTSSISAACTMTGADHYLFWDDIHPTTRVDMILAGQLGLALGVPEPASAVLLAIGLTLLVSLRYRRFQGCERADVLLGEPGHRGQSG